MNFIKGMNVRNNQCVLGATLFFFFLGGAWLAQATPRHTDDCVPLADRECLDSTHLCCLALCEIARRRPRCIRIGIPPRYPQRRRQSTLWRSERPVLRQLPRSRAKVKRLSTSTSMRPTYICIPRSLRTYLSRRWVQIEQMCVVQMQATQAYHHKCKYVALHIANYSPRRLQQFDLYPPTTKISSTYVYRGRRTYLSRRRVQVKLLQATRRVIGRM